MASHTGGEGGRCRKARRTAAKPRESIQFSQSVRKGREGEGARPPEPERWREEEEEREEAGRRAAQSRREQRRAVVTLQGGSRGGE
jgi:hypothetical protein